MNYLSLLHQFRHRPHTLIYAPPTVSSPHFYSTHFHISVSPLSAPPIILCPSCLLFSIPFFFFISVIFQQQLLLHPVQHQVMQHIHLQYKPLGMNVSNTSLGKTCYPSSSYPPLLAHNPYTCCTSVRNAYFSSVD